MTETLQTDSAQAIVELSPRQFRDAFLSDEHAVLIDVRQQEEFDAAHLAGATLIDMLDEVAFREAMKNFSADYTYYIYCRSGRRSHTAATWMVAEGLRTVDMLGGILAWQEDGLPVTTD